MRLPPLGFDGWQKADEISSPCSAGSLKRCSLKESFKSGVASQEAKQSSGSSGDLRGFITT